MQGADLAPVLHDPGASVRDHILFAQDSAQTVELNKVRYALRGFYDGRTKYARYYGVGGGKPSTGLWGKPAGQKLFDVDCAIDDNDHEWYDHDSDPDELVNLANDRTRRGELAELFDRLKAMERESFLSIRLIEFAGLAAPVTEPARRVGAPIRCGPESDTRARRIANGVER